MKFLMMNGALQNTKNIDSIYTIDGFDKGVPKFFIQFDFTDREQSLTEEFKTKKIRDEFFNALCDRLM